jgi:hypothetical protein
LRPYLSTHTRAIRQGSVERRREDHRGGDVCQCGGDRGSRGLRKGADPAVTFRSLRRDVDVVGAPGLRLAKRPSLAGIIVAMPPSVEGLAALPRGNAFAVSHSSSFRGSSLFRGSFSDPSHRTKAIVRTIPNIVSMKNHATVTPVSSYSPKLITTALTGYVMISLTTRFSGWADRLRNRRGDPMHSTRIVSRGAVAWGLWPTPRFPSPLIEAH